MARTIFFLMTILCLSTFAEAIDKKEPKNTRQAKNRVTNDEIWEENWDSQSKESHECRSSVSSLWEENDPDRFGNVDGEAL